MDALAYHRPALATVLDWEHPDQLGEVLSWAYEAAAHAGRIVIVPKVPGAVSSIPHEIRSVRVVLGYSIPTSYGGSPVPLWEFGTRPVHLLGGSPQKQLELADYLNVQSCDGNMAHQQAHCCRFWSARKTEKGRWAQLATTGDLRGEGANREAFRRSLDTIWEAWERKK